MNTKITSLFVAVGILCWSGVGLAVPAQASPISLPDAVFGGEVSAATNAGASDSNIFGSGFYTSSINGPAGTAFSQVRQFEGPAPYVAAESSVYAHYLCVGCLSYSQASNMGNMTYNIEFLGPGAQGTTIPVKLQAYGQASSSIGSQANAFLSLQSGYDPGRYFQASSQNGVPANGDGEYFNVSAIYQLLANVVYSINLQATTSASVVSYVIGSGESAPNSALATASVDPMFTIDPSYTDYSILLSPNVGNALQATPLPSTWLMLLSGFVGLGFFAYRGTKKNAAALASA